MDKQFVIVQNEKIFVDDRNYLSLNRKKISKLNQVYGLEDVFGIRFLDLGNYSETMDNEDSGKDTENFNNLKGFKPVKSLESLERLDLSHNYRLKFIS